MNINIFSRPIPFIKSQLINLILTYSAIIYILYFADKSTFSYLVNFRALAVFIFACMVIMALRWIIVVPWQINILDDKLVLNRRIFQKKVILFSEISEMRERSAGIALRLNNGRTVRVLSCAYSKSDFVSLVAALKSH